MTSLRSASVLFCLLAIVAGCGSDRSEGQDPERVHIDLAVSTHLTNAVMYIGVAEGYFADEGLDVELHPTTESGSTSLPAIDRGLLDVSTMNNVVAIANAIDQGARVRVVGGTSYVAADRCSPSALVARKGLFPEDRPITPSDLRGKRIEFNPLSSEGYFLDVFLAREGLSTDDVEAVSIPIPARLEAMNRGAIDLTGTPEPWLSRLVEAGHRVVLRRNEVIPDFQSSYVVYGSQLLDEDREAGRRFMTALLKAARQFNEGPTERNLEIARQFTELNPEELRTVCWPVLRPDGVIQPAQILQYERWALSKGLLNRMVDVDELWDPWFTQAANQR